MFLIKKTHPRLENEIYYRMTTKDFEEIYVKNPRDATPFKTRREAIQHLNKIKQYGVDLTVVSMEDEEHES